MNCREFIQFLDDYQAGSLDAERAAAFERHLADCPPCVAYLQTYRRTIDLCRESGDALPADAPPDLVKAILASRRQAR